MHFARAIPIILLSDVIVLSTTLTPPPTHPHSLKKPGPVNGTECYYWRTTGCQFGIQCRYEHLPENKGVDLPTMV